MIPKLDADIAILVPSPETARRFAWPLAGLLERPIAEERDVWELADRLEVILAADTGAIVVGTSKSQQKPGTRIVLALLRGESIPDEQLAAVLQVADRDLNHRRGKSVTWVERDDALRVLQRMVILQQAPVRTQGSVRGVRCAIYDLVRLAPTVHAINALACSVGLVDVGTGEIDWSLLADVIGYDAHNLFYVADQDRQELHRAKARRLDRAAEWLTPQQRESIRRRAVDTPTFDAAVDQVIVDEVKRRVDAGANENWTPADTDDLTEDARANVLNAPVPALAKMAGIDIEALAREGDEDGEVDRDLEGPGIRKRAKVGTEGDSTAARYRNWPAYQQRIAQPLRGASPPPSDPRARERSKRLAEAKPRPPSPALRRIAEAVLADPKTRGAVGDEAAKVLGQIAPVAEQSAKSRPRTRRARP